MEFLIPFHFGTGTSGQWYSASSMFEEVLALVGQITERERTSI